MNMKEYLNQARYVDGKIQSKLQQISSLTRLATNCNAVIDDTPRAPGYNNSKISNTVVNIVMLQEEIKNDIDELIALKREITEVISKVDNQEYQLLLEKRYLCYLSWEQIAVDMGYSIQHIYRLHSTALSEVRAPF